MLRCLTVLALISAALGSVGFVGFPAGGNVTVDCSSAFSFPVGNYFSQTCVANNCIAPVTFTWSPDLSAYGFALNTTSPATISVRPTEAAVALGSLSTTISANDNDGPSASGRLNFVFSCPLTLASPIPDQDVTEGTTWTLNASTYFLNPARHSLSWTLVGFASNSSLVINSQGVIRGIVGAADALAVQPIRARVIVNDTTTNNVSVLSNFFNVRVTPLPGISFPSALGVIPAQTATEGALYSFATSRHFANPSNFRVTWSISAPSLPGLQIDPATGTISVTPGQAELLATVAQPASITITGIDERGNMATSNTFRFQVVPARLAVLPVPSPLPSLSCGTFCCSWNPLDYVSNPSSNPATFTLVSGLPGGSQIRLSANGTLSGIASLVDVQFSPIILQVTVNNGQSAPTPMPAFIFSVTSLAAPTLSGQVMPVRTIKVGSFFQLDTRSYFTIPSGSVVNWTLVGTSSLSIDFNGRVSGTLLEQDYLNNPNMTVVVTASNRGTCGGGQVSASFNFTIDPNWQGPSCQGVQSAISVCEKTQFPLRNFSALCRDPTNSRLNYTITGLPNNTGLVFDSTTATLRGTVSATAADNGASTVAICAMNEHGLQDCTQPFQIMFQRAKRPPFADPPIPSPVTAIMGKRFVGYFNFHFYEPDAAPLIYSVAGLPLGSGLGIGPLTGIFSGTPNFADLRASPLVLSVFASNEQNSDPKNKVCASQGQGGRARSDLIIIVEEPPSNPICLPIADENQVAQVGMFWARDVSRSFQPGINQIKLEYALRSLPRGSGLTIDPRSGVISGVLTQQDLAASPLTIVVATTNGNSGCQSSFSLRIGSRIAPSPAIIVRPTPALYPRPGGNGCDRNNGGCDKICMNQNGYPVCSCPPNWFLNSDRLTCGYDPCGSNNGGCEQLCTANGQMARCDCRVGTLNPDGRTCKSQIIVVGTIPPGLVLGCQYFLFDISTAFRHAAGSPLTFRMTGLPPQSGFSISSGGLISGNPLPADCSSAQPMTLTVTATDGVSSVQAVMFLSVFCDGSCKGASLPSLPAPTTPVTSIPVMWAWVCRPFNFDLAPYFLGGTGMVTFSLLGLPTGSGFSLTSQGLIQGTPNSADCFQSPLTFTVVARDSSNRESKAVVTVKFSSCGCVQQPSFKGTYPTPMPFISQPIISQPILSQPIISQPVISQPVISTLTSVAPSSALHTHAVAECGRPFFLDTVEYFRVNNLVYSMTGLPPGTGLRLSDSGVLSGIPNSVDSRSVNPLMASITGTDRSGASVNLIVDIEIKGNCGDIPPIQNQFVTNYRSGFALAADDANTGILPVQTAVAGQLFRLDMSRVAFSALRGKVRYEVIGLPSESGLAMTSAGVLSGTPTRRACQPNPVALTVIAYQDTKQGNASLYIQFTCDANASALSGAGSQLPTATGVVGELLYYDCAPYMASAAGNVQFDITGLTPGSQLRMSAAGVLSGVPSLIDVKGPSLLITAKDKMNNTVQNTLRLNIVAQAQGNRPPTFIPLEAVHVSAGQVFSINVTQRFYDQDGDNLTFTIADLDPQSGIKFARTTGSLNGTASDFDLKQRQPIIFKILADDGRGGKTEGSFFVFFVSSKATATQTSVEPKNVTSSTSVNRDPISLSIKRQVAVEGVPFLFGVASSFIDQDGDVLQYTVDGLPKGTGLTVDRTSGVIAGTPSKADADALQPLSITVSVTDGQGGSCAQIFLLTVFAGEESSNHEPDVRPLPDTRALVGQLFFLRLSASFADSDGDLLTYSVKGLPAKTGLQVLPSAGILTGTPTAEDQAASPISLEVNVDDGRGGHAKSLLKLIVSQAPAPSSQGATKQDEEIFKKVSASGVVSIQFEIGQWGFFSASTLFPTTRQASYAIDGLPQGTGLSINATTGVLSGASTLADVIAADSLPYRLLPITITCKDASRNVLNQSLMLSLFSPLDMANHAPFARIIPKSQAYPGQEFLLDIWASFADPDGDDLLFSVLGLPPNSGFRIVPSQGVLFGIPTEADITAPQPLVLTIVADDQRGGKSQENLILTVSEVNSQTKSCRQLGWPMVTDSSLCARAPKVLGGCPQPMPFSDAQKFCSALGARLCSSQELSDPRFTDTSSDECNIDGQRVWTSSWCADGEVISQASVAKFLSTVPKECSQQEEKIGLLRCCANGDEIGPRKTEEVAAVVSEKTCDQIPSFSTSPSAPNKAVCSTSLVLTGKGKGKAQCSGDVTFKEAKQICSKRGARLCTADELSQDVGNDLVCGYNSQRVWTSSECPFENQVLTQAGASAFLRSVPKQCTKTTTKLPVYCCADQKQDSYFQNLNVNTTAHEINLSWNWKVYPVAQVSLRKASASKGNVVWSSPQNLKEVKMGGDAFVSLSRLDASTRYAIRITPKTEDRKLAPSQAVEFRVSTA